MRWFFILAFAMFFGGQASAQNVPPEGSTINGHLAIGRSTFALPPGEWKVVATDSGAVTIDGTKAGSSVGIVVLVQLDANGTFIAGLLHRAPLTSSNVGNWNDTLCDRKDTLFRDVFSGRFNFPECLLINHVVNFWVTAPTNPLGRKIWDWYRANNVKLPATALVATYRKYFSGDYVNVEAYVNPEYFGQDQSTKTAWAESEWHSSVIKNDPKRAAFVESFKKWSYVMADNARVTLTDRKPKSASLPAFDELGGAAFKSQPAVAKVDSTKSVEQRLIELKALMEKGLISKDQYDERSGAILKSM